MFGGAGDSTHLTVPLWLSLARPSFPETSMTSSGKQESKPVDATGSCDCGPKCVGLDCDSRSGDAGIYHASSSSHQRFPAPWISCSPPPPPPPDSRIPVEYTFIEKRFHPLTLSSRHDFIQFRHFHPNAVSSNEHSSNNCFIPKIHMWDNQYSPCLCENVAGRRPATFSHKHG